MGIKSREHLYFFSRKTLEKYLDKNGFTMEKCTYVGKFITPALLIDRLKYYFGPLAGIAGVAKRILPQHFYLNPYDILYVAAKKK